MLLKDKKTWYLEFNSNQCNTDKQDMEEKCGDVENKLPDIIGLVTTAVLNTEISEAENKIRMLLNLAKK